MKVLFVSSGNAKNGIGTIVKEQGESLKKAGINISYFTINGKGLVSYLKHILILRKLLRNSPFDLIHAHYSLSSFTATFAGSKPLVVSLMGSDTKSRFILKTIIMYFSLFRWKAVIVKSDSMKNDIKIRKAMVIPNGIDLNKVSPSLEIKKNSTIKTILFAADPSRYAKNFPLAKTAVSLLINSSAQLKVVHSKSHVEIIQEINKADVLLQTSRWEGSPNIIKEAMACNCPIVSTNVGDVEWLFGNEPGHFLTTFEPENVAEKIQLALKFAAETGRTNGRHRIIELGLDSETVAGRIVGVYEEILGEGKKERRDLRERRD